jgi:hypothetical protein
MHFFPELVEMKKLIVPSESAPPELSNEWSMSVYFDDRNFFCAVSVSHPW